MQASAVISQVLGITYVIVGFGLLLNPANYQRILKGFCESPALSYLGGLLALIFGLTILVFHHVWSADWTFFITLVGWLALIKGSLFVAYPNVVLQLSRRILARPARLRVWGIFPIALGLFLSVKGYTIV